VRGPEHPGQFRLTRIQLVNWGTFEGYRDITVPRKGVLITGASGSGKSSLLDAIAAIMVQPRWLAFNAAAQQSGQGDRSRDILSYVRGAHRRDVDESTGQVTTTYLRTGATWSGIALTFDDADGRTVSLLRLMHATQQASSPADVSNLYVDADQRVDLQSLRPLVENGIDSRGIKAAHPGWWTNRQYNGFASRLQRKLGLASDRAQRLLHKTQSAKNLGSLNTLLRDFMLDEPDTFGLADAAVEQFEELSGAHRAVVDAREQVAALEPLEAISTAYHRAVEALDLLEAEQHHAETFFTRHRVEIADTLIAACQTTLKSLSAEIDAAERRERDATAAREQCQARIAGLGGHRIPDLERQRSSYQDILERCRHALADAENRAAQCDLTLPDSPAGWTGWQDDLTARLRGLDEEDSRERDANYSVLEHRVKAKDAVDTLSTDLRALESQHSNMEAALLLARTALADELGVTTDELPFAGELIDVLPDQTQWQGAIERVLRPLARTLLVPDEISSRVAAAVDRRSWGTRLVWERVRPDSPAPSTPATTSTSSGASPTRPGTLPGKVAVLASSPFAGWLTETLARRYDYRCVDDVSEFSRLDRGLTRAGQVKHSRTRHEKDDRWKVSDRTRWLLGSSTAAKHDALARALDQARAVLETAIEAADALDERIRHRHSLRTNLTELIRTRPEDLDVDRARADIDSVETQLRQLRAGNQELALAESELPGLQEAESAARSETQQLQVDARVRHDEMTSLTTRRERWTAALRRAEDVPEKVREALEARIRSPRQPRSDRDDRLDLEDLETLHRSTTTQISEDQRTTQSDRDRQIKLAENRMRRFKETWPQRAADLQDGVDYLPEYLRQLEQLRADRLPEFEARFFDLLQSQSRNNITALANRIRISRREVRNRIDPINESLMRTEYARGRHLQVRVCDRSLPEVRDFLRELQQITTDSLSDVMEAGDDPQARQGAEERFLRIQRLMARLRSQELVDRRWRELCLDTRIHVEFRAEVLDAESRAVDFYEDAGGRSGGERQKFVTFCLAAALRYQLARDGATLPGYGVVALDEAFDKTDPEFTRAGLEVFRDFGFQLLLATPMKMLQTLEDYVGGIILFQNEPGRPSRIMVSQFQDPGAQSDGDEVAREERDDVQAPLL